jgi:hypothetical protein
MKKKLLAVFIAVAICLPCALIFDGSPFAPYGEDKLSLANIIGVAWLAFLVLGGFRWLTPSWVRDELTELTIDED